MKVFQTHWDDVKKNRFEVNSEIGLDGKMFLGDRLDLDGAEVSMNVMPPGAGVPFFHRHKTNEELYLFLSGTGEMQVGEEMFNVSEGTCVRVQPEAKRIWRNTGEEDLRFLCIQYLAGSQVEHGIADGEVVDSDLPW